MVASHCRQRALLPAIAAFLQSLTASLPESYIARPSWPESGPKAPRPDPA